jgi:[acyl-carrier-protein] S-malonyltransferase
MTVGYFVTRAAREDNEGVREFYEAFPVVRKLYADVGEWTGISLDDLLSYQLPEEHGLMISYAGVRSIAAQIAVTDVLAEAGVRPSAILALSLGITSASCMAGALGRRDTFRMLRAQGGMPLPGPGDRPQGVATCVIKPGMDPESIYGDGVEGVYLGLDFGPAPDGSGRWAMLSGYRDSLEKLAAERPEVAMLGRGLAAVHSPLHRPAAEFNRKLVADMEFRDPEVPVTTCLDRTTLTSAAELREAIWTNLMCPAYIPYGLDEVVRHGVRLLIVPGPSMADDLVTFPVPIVRVQRPADVEGAVARVAEIEAMAVEG